MSLCVCVCVCVCVSGRVCCAPSVCLGVCTSLLPPSPPNTAPVPPLLISSAGCRVQQSPCLGRSLG